MLKTTADTPTPGVLTTAGTTNTISAKIHSGFRMSPLCGQRRAMTIAAADAVYCCSLSNRVD